MSDTNWGEFAHHYLRERSLASLPGWDAQSDYQLQPLAQGEYHVNFLLHQGSLRWVLRINVASQLGREDQILYEYEALKLLAPTGRTPLPFYADNSREIIPNGLLIMEYLPGEALDYRRDLAAAGELFADIHGGTAGLTSTHLIAEDQPLSQMFVECAAMVSVYLTSDLADPGVRDYLEEVMRWAEAYRHNDRYFVGDPWHCVINTEVNSGNFIANRSVGTLHLIDWEKPLHGDPGHDLSHFMAPTTTLWKTDIQLGDRKRDEVFSAYRERIADPHLRDTIEERTRLFDPMNCLRGVTWCAMASIQYQSGAHALLNEDTARKLAQYTDLPFLRALFSSYVE